MNCPKSGVAVETRLSSPRLLKILKATLLSSTLSPQKTLPSKLSLPRPRPRQRLRLRTNLNQKLSQDQARAQKLQTVQMPPTA